MQQYSPQQQSTTTTTTTTTSNSYEFLIKSSKLGGGDLQLTLSHQDSVATLYQQVYLRYRSEDSYLKYGDHRLPNSPAPISTLIPINTQGRIELELVSSLLDNAVTLKYMCEKCGYIFWRNPDDAIECTQNTCRHGILLKCRKEGTITSYDCR